jgi:ABC-type uncharacterized transport system substrate-binding protein
VDRRIFLTGLGATLTLPLPGEAQPVGKIPRVGIINLAADEPAYAAFRERLRELGWIEGRNVVLESRFVHGNADRYAAFAAELVRLNVDVIVTTGGELGAHAAQRATSTLPIVVGILGPDPVAESLVTSIKSPGGNLTGFVLNSFETSGKRLEVLKDALPRLSRVGLLYDPGQASTTKGHLEAAGQAARALSLQLETAAIRGPASLDQAFTALAAQGAKAIAVVPSQMLHANRVRVVELAAKHRLPAIYPEPEYAKTGGLLSYGPVPVDNYRRVADYVDRILKGAKVADLPVEYPSKFRLVINLKTAKALGLTIPPALLQRADQVIE